MPMDIISRKAKSSPRRCSIAWFTSICGVLPNDTELSRPAIPLFTCLFSIVRNIEERLENGASIVQTT